MYVIIFILLCSLIDYDENCEFVFPNQSCCYLDTVIADELSIHFAFGSGCTEYVNELDEGVGSDTCVHLLDVNVLRRRGRKWGYNKSQRGKNPDQKSFLCYRLQVRLGSL